MNDRTTYETLIQCYLSGQMSERQFARHCSEDEVFAAWAARRLSGSRKGAAA
jgi:hypothetical protein